MPYANSGSSGRGKSSRPSKFSPHENRNYIKAEVPFKKEELFVGDQYGNEIRKILALDEFENGFPEDVVCHIIFLPETFAVTSTFLRGLFGDSLKKYNTVSSFFNRYKFTAREDILKNIESFIALETARIRQNS